ncbi:unnamed protein product [Cuscuta europaea]|uniref:Uncharacterized protein n=1 Tax=Cuscuta europaea TaxID=41803 RepID=A0A9P0YRR4_CUSEU|nr:unnamed protein product [Cuscuta europaea]
MKKQISIYSHFKRKTVDSSCSPSNPIDAETANVEVTNTSKYLGCSSLLFDIKNLERDSGKRPQIWEYPVNQRDEVIRAYLEMGPYQIHLGKYLLSDEKRPRRFQFSVLLGCLLQLVLF